MLLSAAPQAGEYEATGSAAAAAARRQVS